MKKIIFTSLLLALVSNLGWADPASVGGDPAASNQPTKSADQVSTLTKSTVAQDPASQFEAQGPTSAPSKQTKPEDLVQMGTIDFVPTRHIPEVEQQTRQITEKNDDEEEGKEGDDVAVYTELGETFEEAGRGHKKTLSSRPIENAVNFDKDGIIEKAVDLNKDGINWFPEDD